MTSQPSTNATRIAFCQALECIPNDIKQVIWAMIPGPPPYNPILNTLAKDSFDEWMRNEWGEPIVQPIDFNEPDDTTIWFPSDEDPQQEIIETPPNELALDYIENPLSDGDLVMIGNYYGRIDYMDYVGFVDRSLDGRKFINEWGEDMMFTDYGFQVSLTTEEGWEVAAPDELLRIMPMSADATRKPVGEFEHPRTHPEYPPRDRNGTPINLRSWVWFGNFHRRRVRVILSDDTNGFILITGYGHLTSWDWATNVEVAPTP